MFYETTVFIRDFDYIMKQHNDKLYKRFGLELSKRKIEEVFMFKIHNYIVGNLGYLIDPLDMDDTPSRKWNRINSSFFDKYSEELLFDPSNIFGLSYEGYRTYLSNLIEIVLSKDSQIEEFLFNLQIFINILYSFEELKAEQLGLCQFINDFVSDYPIMGIKANFNISRPCQIFPAPSKITGENIAKTLDVLDEERYKNTFKEYYQGVKLFLNHKNNLDLKSVVDRMHSACDEIVKDILGDQNKSFRSYVKNPEQLNSSKAFCQMFKSMKNIFDSIKHGSNKDFDKAEIETIIMSTGVFINHLILKND